jgi:hypothetical protein
MLNYNVLCCPVLNPQISGDPVFPGAVTENPSVTHWPIDPPKKFYVLFFSFNKPILLSHENTFLISYMLSLRSTLHKRLYF